MAQKLKKSKPKQLKKVLGKKASVKSKRKSNLVLKENAVPYRVEEKDLVTLEEAEQLTGKTIHNIRDYIQRGRIAKLNPEGKKIERAQNGELRVSLKELRAFLYLVETRDEKHHYAGLHPELGFYDVPERERTKHVHRLHPYLKTSFAPKPFSRTHLCVFSRS